MLLRLGLRLFAGLGCPIFTLGAAQNKIERFLTAHRLTQRLAIFFLAIEFGSAVAIARGLRDDCRHPFPQLFVIDLDFFLIGELGDRVAAIVTGSGRSRDRAAEFYRKEESREALRQSMRREKALDFILSRAQREDAPSESSADSPSEPPEEGSSEQK